METDLYTYADSWKNQLHSKTLWKTIRRTYFTKSVLLLLTLPLDALILAFILISKKRFNVLIATEKWPKLTEITASRTRTACISPVTFFKDHLKSKARYFPASIFYLLSALGLALPNQLRKKWSDIAVYLVFVILRRVTNKSATLVVHSDALPFGRALVMAANKSGIRTVCIQHGNFREYNVIREQDGFLCTNNIVRSIEDGNIIKKTATQTLIHVDPGFFTICIGDNASSSIAPKVLLLGEGYHIIDSDFNEIYLKELELLQYALTDLDVSVAFRPHPSERKMVWRNRFKEIDLAPLEHSLTTADAVVGYSSTLLQESAEIGIPTFYLDPQKRGHSITGRNGAVIYKLNSPEQVVEILKSNLNNLRKIQIVATEDKYSNALDVLLKGV